MDELLETELSEELVVCAKVELELDSLRLDSDVLSDELELESAAAPRGSHAVIGPIGNESPPSFGSPFTE